jgi:hypothetical protein
MRPPCQFRAQEIATLIVGDVCENRCSCGVLFFFGKVPKSRDGLFKKCAGHTGGDSISIGAAADHAKDHREQSQAPSAGTPGTPVSVNWNTPHCEGAGVANQGTIEHAGE